MKRIDINYDEHYTKHCVRYYGWLPAGKEFMLGIRGRPIKYFTLCAEQAIDIFMFELAGILRRDSGGMLPNVTICEAREDLASRICNLVKPPLRDAVLVGELEDIFNFENTPATQNRSSDEDDRDSEIRRMLRLKGLNERMKAQSPFDIVNFDPYKSLVNPCFTKNRLYHAFSKLFELQEKTDSFLLFVTTDVSSVDQDVESQFRKCVNDNYLRHATIRDSLEKTQGANSQDPYAALSVAQKKAFGFTKAVLISAAKDKNWFCEHQGIYFYTSKGGGGQMLSSVVKCFRGPAGGFEEMYIRDVTKVMTTMPRVFSLRDARKDHKVQKHLRTVIKHRDAIRKIFYPL